MWLDAEAGVATFRNFSQSFPVGRFQWKGVEQNRHHEIQPPDFVGLSETVDTTHLSLLIWRREYAASADLTGDRLYEVLPVFRTNVLAQLRKQLRCPFPLHLGWLRVQLVLALPLFFGGHSPIVVLVKLALASLEIEPREGESADMWKQSFDELALLIL